jgi:GT2 family glycosyltransferase
MALPFVSLVVVNYNGEGIIKLCLSSLTKVDYPKNRYEIIVVDNASTDKSISIIKSFQRVKLIQNKCNMGYVGVNSCLNKVKGKYIFILNNDLEMEKNCIKNLVKIIEKDKTIGVVVPKFINFYNRKIESSGTWVSRAFYNGHYTDSNEKPAVKEIPYLGIEMVRSDILKKFGYIYDPDYFIYAEDLDLSLRFRLLGYKTVFVPDAVVYHMHAATTKKSKSYKMTFLLERNLLMTYFKILSFWNMILLMPYVFYEVYCHY